MLSVLAALVAGLAMPVDTVLLLGSRNIDLTGDGQEETLSLIGTGPSIDSLEVTFQIATTDGVLYAASLSPIKRTEGDDRSRRIRTSAEQAEFVAQFGRQFFADTKFAEASRFLADLGGRAPGRVPQIPSVIARHRATYENHAIGRLELAPMATDTAGAGRIWAEMLARERIVFWFSPGGDGLTAIAWSDGDQRFYRLLECC